MLNNCDKKNPYNWCWCNIMYLTNLIQEHTSQYNYLWTTVVSILEGMIMHWSTIARLVNLNVYVNTDVTHIIYTIQISRVRAYDFSPFPLSCHFGITKISKTIRSASNRLGSDAKVSDRCLLDVDPMVFAVWEYMQSQPETAVKRDLKLCT